MYGKIFPQIFDSTLMADGGSDAVYLMMSLVVLKDSDGAVNIDRRVLAKRLDLSLRRFDAAMAVLLAPDPDSNLPAMDGRRVCLLSGVPHVENNRGYYVINHEHYRDKGGHDDKRNKAAQRQQRYRDRHKKNNELDGAVTHRNATVTPSNAKSVHKDTDKDTDIDTKKERGANAPARKQKGARWTADKLPAEWLYWAEQSANLRDSTLHSEAAKFCDYWIGVPGAKGIKLDWFATWRNWIRRSTESKQGKSNGHQPKPSLLDQVKQANAYRFADEVDGVAVGEDDRVVCTQMDSTPRPRR